ncbi:hypothetical protein [Streptomyces sp. A012304]|uniref:hypothetical protein n=1 Tax=Streptomyces sp. A012304 TaxID=375446 RepID=UPI00222E1937|nr:hypothetical protein [Streptomyces sp. A012304]GKQ38412.1 hypothetical protein ALMP_49440 [Streptomyces sp. A012304]
MRNIVRAAGAAVAGLALVGAVQAPAQAAGTTAESVPSCVTAKDYLLTKVIVVITNNCTTTQRVNVAYAYLDTPYVPDRCHTLAPGQEVMTSEYPWLANRYVGLIPC